MRRWEIIWDLVDDAEGNVQHILEHDVSVDEVEDVLLDPNNETIISRESGNPHYVRLDIHREISGRPLGARR